MRDHRDISMLKMKLLYFLVLQYTKVYCNFNGTHENETDIDIDPTTWSDKVTVSGNTLNMDYNSSSNSSSDETSDEKDNKIKGVIYTSESEEEKYSDGGPTLNNDRLKFDKDSDNNTQNFYNNHTVTETATESNSTAHDGTDILLFLESLFEKAPFPSEQDIPMLNRKVFRGARVTIAEHPYIVSIRRKLSHYLTGTLLTQRVVVTVAQPIYMIPISELRAVVGENYNDRGTLLLTIILTIVHEDFDPNTLGADLALLMIYEDINYKVTVKPIPIYAPTQPLEGETAFVTGWGRCDRSGKELCLPRSSHYYRHEIMDPMLRTVKFKINDTSCSKDYNDKNLNFGMICPGDSRTEDLLCPCMAVPGAPLVVAAALAGIQSWGFGCGYVDDRPLVYTSTAVYQPWLIHNIPILRNLSKDDLTPLFEATKANFIIHWLRNTRINTPKIKAPLSTDINAINADLKLVRLKGKVYDIRDFMYNLKFRKTKKILYDNIRIQLSKRPFRKFKITDMLRVNPFMDAGTLNETHLSLVNGSLVQSGESEDTSYEVTDDFTHSDLGTEETEYYSFYKKPKKPVIHF